VTVEYLEQDEITDQMTDAANDGRTNMAIEELNARLNPAQKCRAAKLKVMMHRHKRKFSILIAAWALQ
jgi:hypothetical protein